MKQSLELGNNLSDPLIPAVQAEHAQSRPRDRQMTSSFDENSQRGAVMFVDDHAGPAFDTREANEQSMAMQRRRVYQLTNSLLFQLEGTARDHSRGSTASTIGDIIGTAESTIDANTLSTQQCLISHEFVYQGQDSAASAAAGVNTVTSAGSGRISHVMRSVSESDLDGFLEGVMQEYGPGAAHDNDAGANAASSTDKVTWLAIAAEDLRQLGRSSGVHVSGVLDKLKRRCALHPLALRCARRVMFGQGVSELYGHAAFLNKARSQCMFHFSFVQRVAASNVDSSKPAPTETHSVAMFVLGPSLVISFSKTHRSGEAGFISRRRLPRANSVDDFNAPRTQASRKARNTAASDKFRSYTSAGRYPGWHRKVVEAIQTLGSRGGEVVTSQTGGSGDDTAFGHLRAMCIVYAALENSIAELRPLLQYYANFLTLLDSASTSVMRPSLVADMQAVQKGLSAFEVFLATVHDASSRFIDIAPERHENAMPYFEDAHQQVAQLVKLVEVYSNSLQGSLEAWSHWHDAMQTQVNTLLALVATVFLPLSFFTGVFGMNFVNPRTKISTMPLLDYEYGYEFFWVMSFVFALWCGVMFHKHRWFEFAGISTRGKIGMLVFSFLCPTLLEIVIYIAQPHIFEGP